jgi:hypothetical protein
MTTNLNDLTIDVDREEPMRLADHGCSDHAHVEAVFRNLDRRLIAEIEAADYVFGSVAWLTHRDIIAALAKKTGVCIIVQKEDFLRPDSAGYAGKQRLRQQYASLLGLIRYEFGLIGQLSVCLDPTLDPIRCVGNLNTDKSPAHPRAHNKFVVFAKSAKCSGCSMCEEPRSRPPSYHLDDKGWELTSVWTGSFNFTHNAVNSLENAVIIRSSKISRAFYNEFQQIAALSEPLDWETNWAAPQWRIGT